ncbi:MAG: hypothetical protein RL538_557 [Candidatus Parcubacteria bacterium]
MTIAKDFASKLAVAFVAIAMIFMAIAPAVQAEETAEDLQKTINDLLAQVAALKAGMGDEEEVATPGKACGVFSMDLKTGSTGADVKALQEFLNSDADTQVAASGVGSAGMETTTFGPMTAAAVSKFQVKYRAEILSPAGLVNPTGFFGPGSRAQANKLCAGAEDGEDTDEDTTDEDTELQGEGTLDDSETDLDDASDDSIMEGEEDAELGTLTLAAQDGDIEVSRLAFQIVDVDATVVDGEVTVAGDNESDLWETFDSITLWVDGDMIGEFDSSDEDNYLDEDNGTFRISGLDLVLPEDEEVEIVIAGNVAGAVDGSDTAGLADWTVDVTDIRYFDADGVASDDTIAVAAVGVDIVEEGVDDDAEIVSSSDTPDAATLKVDEDTAESDEFDVHTFTIEVDEDSSDLVFNDEAYVDVTVANPSTTTLDPAVEDVIDAVYLTIDGETIEGDTDDADEDDAINQSGSETVTYSFDFDGMTLDADTDYDATVSIVFKGQDGVYENGMIVTTDVDGSTWEVEGLAGDFDVLTGTDGSEDMTLATVVPEISDVSSEVDRNEAGDAGTISFEFTVGADDDDVVLAVADNADVSTTSADDIAFTLSGTDTSIAVAQLTKTSGDATYAGGEWTIADGDEATFVLDVAFTTAASGDNGTYRVTLDTIGGVEVDETSAGMSLTY